MSGGTKYILRCPEGFTSQSYQRLQLFVAHETILGSEVNISVAMAEMWNARIDALSERENRSSWFFTSKDRGGCFFVESGESANIEDLAEALKLYLLGNESILEIVNGE